MNIEKSSPPVEGIGSTIASSEYKSHTDLQAIAYISLLFITAGKSNK